MATTQQTVVLELPHDLTNEEKLQLQKKIMKFLDTKEELEDELASAQAEFKSAKASVEQRTKDVDTDINRVRSEIKMGREMRKYTCNVFRDVDTQMVEYAVIGGPNPGVIVKREPFSPDDWAAVQQLDIPFDDEPVSDGEPAEQPDLRAQASLTDKPALTPNVDEMGNVVAGADTDAYNMAHADSPYQHLSEYIGFTPQVTSVQAADAAAESTSAPDVDRDDEHDLGTPHTDEADSDDDEPTEDDEPGDEPTPTPKVPKRPAKKRKPSAE